VQEQGAATVITKNASPGRIRDAIEQLLLDGPHRDAAARLGARIREHDAATTAADHLSALVPSA
jgi:UDP:flavonoid glycosyltransferase YjiC (YdhE family)